MSKRHKNAYEIWNVGASNPRGVARALVEAIDEACTDGCGSEAANDPAVWVILDQLCFLCGLPQPGSQCVDSFDAALKICEDMK